MRDGFRNLVQHAITLARNNPKTQVSGFGSVTSLLGLSNLAPLVPLIILPRRHFELSSEHTHMVSHFTQQ